LPRRRRRPCRRRRGPAGRHDLPARHDHQPGVGQGHLLGELRHRGVVEGGRHDHRAERLLVLERQGDRQRGRLPERPGGAVAPLQRLQRRPVLGRDRGLAAARGDHLAGGVEDDHRPGWLARPGDDARGLAPHRLDGGELGVGDGHAHEQAGGDQGRPVAHRLAVPRQQRRHRRRRFGQALPVLRADLGRQEPADDAEDADEGHDSGDHERDGDPHAHAHCASSLDADVGA
jgi:hypothetical protein